jgi:hypothetical protein
MGISFASQWDAGHSRRTVLPPSPGSHQAWAPLKTPVASPSYQLFQETSWPQHAFLDTPFRKPRSLDQIKGQVRSLDPPWSILFPFQQGAQERDRSTTNKTVSTTGTNSPLSRSLQEACVDAIAKANCRIKVSHAHQKLPSVIPTLVSSPVHISKQNMRT